MFIDHQISYLDIVKLCDACCEAHMADIVATPNLEEIVHYDQWVSDDTNSHGLMPYTVVGVAGFGMGASRGTLWVEGGCMAVSCAHACALKEVWDEGLGLEVRWLMIHWVVIKLRKQ